MQDTAISFDVSTRPRRGRRRAIAVACAAALLAAGCGGDDGEATESATTDVAASDTAATTAATATTEPADATDTTAASETSTATAATDAAGPTAEDPLGPEVPAAGEPVKVGLISDGKNPTTDLSIELDVGDATVEYLNQHKGGLGGRPIELVKCVAELDPAKAADCANQMVEENVVVVTIGSSAVMESIWQPLHDAAVPMVFFATGGAKVAADSETSFVMSSPFATQLELPIAAAEGAGESKVTVVVIDVPAALSLWQSVGPAMFEERGIDLEVVTVPPGTADMTPQMQQVANGEPGVVHVIGNDSFCISAFNGLRAVGFEGPVTTISQCVTDATREAVPGEFFDNMTVGAAAPIGADDETAGLYPAVMEKYGNGIDTSRVAGWGMFMALAGLATAVEGISGDITPASVIATIKAMPEKDLPGSGGLRFRCNGKAVPIAPAACVRAGLVTTLDANGQPTEYQKVGDTPIED